MHNNFLKTFSLKNKIAVITGGCGMLGIQHAEAIAEIDGIPVPLILKKIKKKLKE